MATTPPFDPGLGTLSRLPPEIRLCIYDWIPPYKRERHMQLRITHNPRSGLGILCASRKLYDEFSHHLYHGADLHFCMSPRISKSWVTVSILQLYWCSWRFWHPDPYIRAFRNFPYHRVSVYIDVSAPNPEDGVQLIILWRKVNQLVDMLAKASSIKQLTLSYYKSPKGHDWTRDGRLATSVDLLD
ncbi:uncharacterized protein BJX67DRAFT_380837 [Aspergillus lucknowensis]|uniref:Uncharacterized protein n=1 Tax=Aspergillus lucknowensis TaxID=176173 RepID=A0ABR4LSG4_9EURO